MPPPSPHRVLIIEDDADARANLRDILELDGFQVMIHHRKRFTGKLLVSSRHPQAGNFPVYPAAEQEAAAISDPRRTR